MLPPRIHPDRTITTPGVFTDGGLLDAIHGHSAAVSFKVALLHLAQPLLDDAGSACSSAIAPLTVMSLVTKE